jgi:hypothetical protein
VGVEGGQRPLVVEILELGHTGTVPPCYRSNIPIGETRGP